MTPVMKKHLIPIALAGSLLAAAPVAMQAQDIVFSAGTADLAWYFDSSTQSWDVLFRSKANTQATGLDTLYTRPREGAPNGTTEFDWQFTSLLTQLSAAPFYDGYYVSRRADITYNDPDFGFRTRLRENVGGTVVDQFDTFTLSLDLASTARPAGSEVALFTYVDGQPSFLLESASDLTQNNYGVWGHSHYHWGFSQQGDYSVVLNFWGTKDGVNTPIGTTTLDFQVIPEPSTVAMFLGLGVLGAALLLRRRKRS